MEMTSKRKTTDPIYQNIPKNEDANRLCHFAQVLLLSLSKFQSHRSYGDAHLNFWEKAVGGDATAYLVGGWVGR